MAIFSRKSPEERIAHKINEAAARVATGISNRENAPLDPPHKIGIGRNPFAYSSELDTRTGKYIGRVVEEAVVLLGDLGTRNEVVFDPGATEKANTQSVRRGYAYVGEFTSTLTIVFNRPEDVTPDLQMRLNEYMRGVPRS